MHEDGKCAAVDPVLPLWDNTSLDPTSLLRRAAFQHCPELYVSSLRPRRLRCKARQYSLGQMLFKLQADPAHPHLGIGNSTERKAGFEEYVRAYAEAIGLACKQVRSSCRREWGAVSLHVQKAWHVV